MRIMDVLSQEGCVRLKLWIDGSSRGNPGPAKASIVFEDGEKTVKDLGVTTNNRAEYQALLLGLKLASKKGLDDVTILTDSQLIDGHINKGWKVNENQDLVNDAKALLRKFNHCKIVWIAREKNIAHID
jgi:ribonuclease HI